MVSIALSSSGGRRRRWSSDDQSGWEHETFQLCLQDGRKRLSPKKREEFAGQRVQEKGKSL